MTESVRDNESDAQLPEALIRDLRTILDVVAERMIQREALLELRHRAREMANQVRVN